MIYIDTSGIDAFNEALSLELLRLDQEISAVFTGWTHKIFTDAVETTPQFSGDTTANWRYAVNAPDLTYNEIPEKYAFGAPHNLLTPHSLGDPEAVAMALANLAAAPKPSWRDTVFISNATPIAEALQGMQIKLRPVNMVTAGVIMIEYAVMRAEAEGLL